MSDEQGLRSQDEVALSPRAERYLLDFARPAAALAALPWRTAAGCQKWPRTLVAAHLLLPIIIASCRTRRNDDKQSGSLPIDAH
jgi:hypothetical protein